MYNKYLTVVELEEFQLFAKKNLSDGQRKEIIDYLAKNPEAGDLIQGTGGLRKFRWSDGVKGKSGGYRIIHYYYNDSIPIFLITGFAKSSMENISKQARNTYKKLLPLLVEQYKRGKT